MAHLLRTARMIQIIGGGAKELHKLVNKAGIFIIITKRKS